MCPEDCCSVDKKAVSSSRIPPGGCYSKLVKVVAWYLTVVSHFVVPRTRSDEILIVQPTLKALCQWLNVMHRQLHTNSRVKPSVIAAVFTIVTDSAQVKITLQYRSLLCLPRIAPSKFVGLANARPVISRFLGTLNPNRMRLAAVNA